MPNTITTDYPAMDQALGLAAQALFLSNPNPRVGCVLTNAAGDVLGQGFTQQAGGPHAEVMALRDAAARGSDVRGATAYVTLEPCSHQGRTGPCCEALKVAGVARVVAAVADPNPLVAGQGFDKLRAAGIDVEVGPGAEATRALNVGFFSRMVRGTPWVRMKSALSLDGVTALNNGVSQWITSPQARADGHAWRARACAVLTGIGTVLADDPSLDVREVATPRQPHLVIVDSQLRTPLRARLWDVPHRQVWIYTTNDQSPAADALRARGAQVIAMPDAAGTAVALPDMLRDLGARAVNELHVEAGRLLNGALVATGLVDEFLLYLAPLLLGAGRPMAAWGPLESLAQGVPLTWGSVEPVGPDLRLLARVPGRLESL